MYHNIIKQRNCEGFFLEYLFLFLADVFLALNFAITKVYQTKNGISLRNSLVFNLLLGLFSALFFWVMQGFSFEFQLYSFLLSFAQSALAVIYTILGFRIMSKHHIAIYSVFLMTGGMVVPYLWGLLFLEEPFSWLRTVGVLVIIAAILLTNSSSKRLDPKQFFLCVAVFFLNGFVSVISKVHQIYPEAVSTEAFGTMNSVTKVFLCLLILPLIPKKAQHSSTFRGWKSILLVAASAVAGSISFLFQLIGAKTLPATVLFPIVTGGSILLTALSGRIFFREKLTRPILAGTLLCLLGTCLFL